MIDALLYAVRDGIRAAGFNYDQATCDLMEDGKPPPQMGNWFVAVHGGRERPGPANSRNKDSLYDFSVTLTGRVAIPMDRLGSQMIARNLSLVSQSQREGFNAKVEQLESYLHMNWRITVLQGQTPNSANDNIAAWGTGTVYGFVEPARSRGAEVPILVGAEWLAADPESEDFALKAEIKFADAKRLQPQTASVGVFL